MKQIQDLRNGDIATIYALCRSFVIDRTSRGQIYAKLELEDQTGTIEGRLWDADSHQHTQYQSRVVVITANVNRYNERLQLKVQQIQVDEQKSPTDYQRCTPFPIDELHDRLEHLINSHLTQPLQSWIRKALQAAPNFAAARAANRNHHSYVGGLLEHTVSMANLALRIGIHYEKFLPGFSTEMLLAGVILHDIGKCWEIDPVDGHYTNPGQLVGHITIGVELLNRVVDEELWLGGPDNPHRKLYLQLKHMILSHHGCKEFGSPVEPKTPEAIVLHYVDQIDSRLSMVRQAFENTDESDLWTGRVRPLGVSLLNTQSDTPWDD